MAATFLIRALMPAAVWLVLTGGDGHSWCFGGPVIVLLAAWRLRESAAGGARFRPWRLVQFLPFFLWRSLAGSCDVAWRALHWRLPIAPVVLTYTFHLPPDSLARVFLVNCIGLLPGTLAAAWKEDELQVHVLAESPGSAAAALRQLESHLALLFGHDAPGPDEESGG